MTSYNFSLSASWWIVVLCGLAALALALYAYRITTPPVSTLRRLFLLALRTLALWTLLFALFEPILTLLRANEEPPRIAVLLDNSQSAGMTDASVNRREQFRSVLQAINMSTLTGGDTTLSTLLFDNAVREMAGFVLDSLKFTGQFSNLSKPLQTVFETAERTNTRAVLLVTDGAFNAGENPLYAAENLGRPLYIVGVGDSTEPKDVKIQSLLTNDIGYVNATLPVSVNVAANGFTSGGDAVVTLKDNGIVVGEQRFLARGSNSSNAANAASNGLSPNPVQQLAFEFKPKEAGVRKITAEMSIKSGFEGEITTKNNIASVFVNVLKNKRKVVVLAGSATPDISFIRTTLTENNNVECTGLIGTPQGDFLNDAGTSAGNTVAPTLAEAESIVLVGFPAPFTPATTVEAVKTEAARGKPLLFIAGRDIDYGKLRPLEPYLPFVTLSAGQQEMLALPDVKAQSLANPVMKLTGTDADAKLWNNLPPIFRTETLFKVKPESEVVATIRVNNVPLGEPLIVQRTLSNAKSLAVLGYGLYRWKLLGYAAEQAKGRDVPDVFATFLDNGLRWLTTNDQGKFVRIKTTRELYANGDMVEFTGQVYDRSYNPVDNADVRVTITGGAGTKQAAPREIPLSALGGGRYTAQVQGLPQGEYAFTGTAAINNQPYGTDEGRFSVGELNIEFQNLRMNAALLRRMAERTGGRFFPAQQVIQNPQAFTDALTKAPSFKARPVTQRSEITVWNRPWLLALAIGFFAVEWFTRKRSGMV
jgi:hypothetical protein